MSMSPNTRQAVDIKQINTEKDFVQREIDPGQLFFQKRERAAPGGN